MYTHTHTHTHKCICKHMAYNFSSRDLDQKFISNSQIYLIKIKVFFLPNIKCDIISSQLFQVEDLLRMVKGVLERWNGFGNCKYKTHTQMNVFQLLS